MPNKKAKDFKKAIGELFAFLKSYRVPLIVALCFALLAVATQIIFPFFVGLMGEIIAGVLPTPILDGYGAVLGYEAGTPIIIDTIIRLGIIVGLLATAGIIFSFLQGFIMTTVTQRVVEALRSRIIKKINALPLKYFDTTSFGDILSRLTSDVDLIGQWLGHIIITLITSSVMLIGVLAMMFTINFIMAFAVIGSTLIGAFVVVFIMKRTQKYFRRQQKFLGELNGQVEETYSGHNVVKAYSAGESVKERFSEVNTELQKASVRADFFSIVIHPFMAFIGNLGFVVVCVVGAMLIISNNPVLGISGAAGFGVIAAFLIYVRLFSQPLTQLSEAAQGIQLTAAASERVFEFLNESELVCEEHKTTQLLGIKGAVSFKNVAFGYRADKSVINNFSCEIPPGSTVAIVGPTGAGKTTIVNLLMRFYEISAGQILIDGVDIKDMRREEVASIFGMVLQDTWVFEGTIYDNILYNSQRTTNNEQLSKVTQAAQLANLDHFIRTLPKGYDTNLDEKSSLSEGQKQLLTIARAFVANSPMLILDEATSSVDTRTEQLIQQATNRLTKGRTTFIIAHRLSTIKNADIILVLKDGDIIENGNHKSLLKANGFYASLYNAQFAA